MRISALSVVATLAAISVQAQYTEINISSQANADIQTYANGGNYQLGGTQLNAGGVPFALAELGGSASTTGVVQSSGGSFDYVFSVPAGTEANALYSLMNTAYGASGVDEGSLVVKGTGGESATLVLTEGDNIRDHNEDGYVNALTDPTVVTTDFQNGAPTTGSDQTRLDRQELILPSTFDGDTIASITFEGDAQGNPNGQAFLAGLTLSNAVPDSAIPFPWLAGGMIFGLAIGSGVKRKQARLQAERIKDRR